MSCNTETSAPVLLPAEDMPVGVELDCGSYAVTEEEIVEFASHWDPQYFHIDRDAAEHSDFGGLIASGLHTAAIFQRLANMSGPSGSDTGTRPPPAPRIPTSTATGPAQEPCAPSRHPTSDSPDSPSAEPS